MDKMIFCNVRMLSAAQGRICWYVAEDERFKVHDLVVVPFGSDDGEAIGEIVEIRCCSENDAPFPAALAKKILRKNMEKDDEREWDHWNGALQKDLRLRLNIEDLDLQFKVKGWGKQNGEWYENWTDLDFCLTGGYINVIRTGEVFTSDEIEYLCDCLGRLLNGELEKELCIGFIEPDFEFRLKAARTIKAGYYPETGAIHHADVDIDISVEITIHFWSSQGLGANRFCMTLDREEIDALYTYLRTVIGTLRVDDSKVIDFLEKGIFLPQ